VSLAIRHPEAVATAAGHSNGVGFALNAQNVAVATAAVGLPPATADEVSGLTATQFTVHAARCRAVSAPAMVARPTFTALEADLVAPVDVS
jgi:PE family